MTTSSEMVRSVAQLLFSYLPNRTVNWEDGSGVVQLDTPRLESSWSPSQSTFVLREVGDYLARWRSLGGEVDPRFPGTGQSARFTVGTPRSIAAHVLPTAFYCRVCLRFLPKLRTGAGRLECPECHRATLRQLTYVFVHGCGHLEPIREAIPIESQTRQGTIFRAPIRCGACRDQSVLRLDARSERISALRVYCERCGSEVIERLLARCPHCLPRLFGQTLPGGQLAARTFMRVTRHSANNAYYPHGITMLRLDRPQVLQVSEDLDWLQSLLPVEERREAAGMATSLQELVLQLASAEGAGDTMRADCVRAQIALVASGGVTATSQASEVRRIQVPQDVTQAARESIALLSTVRRTDVALFGAPGEAGRGTAQAVAGALGRLGIRRVELVDDLPVINAVFGYTRRSPNPTYREEVATQDLQTMIRPFPNLDDDAGRVLQRPQAAGTTPILAREGTHEGLAIFLDPGAVCDWLARLGMPVPAGTERDRIGHLLSALEGIGDDRFCGGIWTWPRRRAVFGLLHTLSHCAMRALGRTAGLEETSVSEYLFLPLLCTVVYSNASTPLGGVRATARHRMLQFLEGIEEEAMRCLYDPDCLHRNGACHGCVHVPEISCRVFNHGLSRALLVGGQAPWQPAANPERVPGFWSITGGERER